MTRRSSDANVADMVIEKYLKKHGLSQKQFGLQVGVSQGMVNQWLKGIRRVSPERAIVIEKKTGGELTRKALCPEVFA